MSVGVDPEVELESLNFAEMDGEQRTRDSPNDPVDQGRWSDDDNIPPKDDPEQTYDHTLDERTKRKLDYILLPFLATLFLLNSLDKSNIGNAETAGFTRDAGLAEEDLNISMGYFFGFFVALQPLGAALGRHFGM